MPFPERRAAPQAIELFDLAIAFWFGHRQENQFDAEVQAQPHELAEDPRGFVAATKRGVVVELQKVWNSDTVARLPTRSRSCSRAMQETQG